MSFLEEVFKPQINFCVVLHLIMMVAIVDQLSYSFQLVELSVAVVVINLQIIRISKLRDDYKLLPNHSNYVALF